MRISIGILIVLCASVSLAQSPHPAFRQYTVKDGLAAADVYQVKQDSKGYIWFATSNGVSRFNGYEFENFSVKDGLPDNTVFEIDEDSKGRIWFMPLSGTLSYYLNGRIHLYEHNDQVLKFFHNTMKTAFFIDKDDNVCFSFFHNVLCKIDTSGKIIYEKHFDKPYHFMIEEHGNDRFLFTYLSGQNVVDQYYTSINTPLQKCTIPFPKSIGTSSSFGRINRLKDNTILLSYDKELLVLNTDCTYRVIQFPVQLIWFYQDREGAVWIGTYMGGIYRVVNNDFEHAEHFLDKVTINGIIQDREGGYWFGGETNAIYYTPSARLLSHDKESGLASNEINCLQTIGPTVFAGTANGRIHRIEPGGRVSGIDIRQQGLRNTAVTRFFYRPEKNWIEYSAHYFSGKIDTNLHLLPNYIDPWKFEERLTDPRNNTWNCGNTGLLLLHGARFVRAGNQASNLKLYCMLVRDSNNLYMGSNKGLWNFNITDSVFTPLGHSNKPLQSRIADMLRLPGSSLLIATNGAGVLLYDPPYLDQISMSTGLANDNVKKLHVRGNEVWVGTTDGLSKMTITNRRPLRYRIVNYDLSDGLPANRIQDIAEANGFLWVATDNGLAFFKPDSLKKNRHEVPIYITRFEINGRDTSISNSYELPYDYNNIKLSFIALSYRNAGKLRYRYKMEGLDTSWNYTSIRETQYTTLPAGNYRFMVSVRLQNGDWSNTVASVRFRLLLPFWKTWWFQLIVLSVIVLLISLAFRRRLKLAQERNEFNRNLLNLKLKALRAQMNPHFIFNVINSIQHFIVNKEEESAHRYLTMFSKLIRTILNNSESNTVPLSEEFKALELYLKLESMRFEEAFEYEIHIDPQIAPSKIEIPSMLIQPYVENAIKHGILQASRPGKIRIAVELQYQFLKCTIEDNGIGRLAASRYNSDTEHRSFGSFITRERLDAINAIYQNKLSETITDLYDPNGQANGTRVEIYIPLIQHPHADLQYTKTHPKNHT